MGKSKLPKEQSPLVKNVSLGLGQVALVSHEHVEQPRVSLKLVPTEWPFGNAAGQASAPSCSMHDANGALRLVTHAPPSVHLAPTALTQERPSTGGKAVLVTLPLHLPCVAGSGEIFTLELAPVNRSNLPQLEPLGSRLMGFAPVHWPPPVGSMVIMPSMQEAASSGAPHVQAQVAEATAGADTTSTAVASPPGHAGRPCALNATARHPLGMAGMQTKPALHAASSQSVALLQSLSIPSSQISTPVHGAVVPELVTLLPLVETTLPCPPALPLAPPAPAERPETSRLQPALSAAARARANLRPMASL
jgi:hypothetical protein